MPRKNFKRRLSAVESLERRLLLFNGFNPTVTLETNFGDIEFEMLEDTAPATVANFLTYINDGDYLDSFFHRLDPGFVLQGGGFTSSEEFFISPEASDTCADFQCIIDDIDPDVFDDVPTDPTIQNEFNISNTRGTVAMAKLGGDPDSATSQFFVNLSDTNTFLDSSNGGFTVFARVNDMTVVDQIATLNQLNIQSAFNPTTQGRLVAATTELPYEVTDDDGVRLVLIQDITGTSLVHGTVFSDDDGNGVLGNEAGISDVIVFDDFNGNGIADSGEQQTTTDADGNYHLTFPGEYDYNIAYASSAGWVATSAENQFGALEIGQSTVDINFGVQINPVTGWHNSSTAEDVNGDGTVAPIDALQVINELNDRNLSDPGTGQLPSAPTTAPDPLFLPDVNNDGIVSPIDAVFVINVLNGDTPTAALSATAVVFAEGETDDSDDEEGLDSLLIDEVFSELI